MDFMLILLWPLRVFAFNPFLCGILAGIFTMPVFLPIYSARSRMALALAAAVWWGFCWQEATLAPDVEVRLDLVRFGPLFLAAAIFGTWNLVRGHQASKPAAPASWRARQRLGRKR